MRKITIELQRRNHIKGYGTFYHDGQPWLPDGEDTLAELTRWSEANPTQQIYRHAVRVEEQPKATLTYHYAPESCALTQEDCARLFAERLDDEGPRHRFESENVIVWRGTMVYRMPLVDEVHYLDIYHQDR